MNTMLRFADWIDVVLMISGTVGAAVDGSALIILFVIISKIMNTLGRDSRAEQIHDGFMHEVQKYCLDLIYTGIATFVAAFAGGYCWSRTGERQVQRIRYKYLEAVLRQEVGFFDSQEATTSEVINILSKDTSLIQDVLSEKVPVILVQSSIFLSAVALSTYFSWRLALVAFPLLLLIIVPSLVYGKYLLHLSRKSREEYGQGSAFVQQALSSIKTIYSFTAEKRIVDRYAAVLDKTLRLGIKQGLAKGLAVGSSGLSFAIWALLAWYGSRMVMYHGLDGSKIYAAGMSLVVGSGSLSIVLSEVKHAVKASVAVTRILKVIDRTPEFDVEDPNGLTLDHLHGGIEFKLVWFTYPSRPDTVVLRDFSLQIPAGKTTALVGASGSGKSTIVALIQRFYDVDKGSITIDGVDVRKLQTKWIRSNMGLVSQDNAIFGTSIKENILFGKPNASMDEVYTATMIANAHDFISHFPEGYNTKVGERGAYLSGGQKQRIAIARALVRNPAILLLDEATSALDLESEKLVQDAIDQASLGRTTVVVAHRLSTVRQADRIVVIKDGEVIESGSHIDLISQQDSHYSQLVSLQTTSNSNDQQQDSCMPSSAADTSAEVHVAQSMADSPLSMPDSIKESATIRHPSPSFFRLLTMNSPEWKQGLVGTLSAVVNGSVRPIYGFSIGGLTAAFYLRDQDEMQAVVRRYALILCSLSVVSIVVNVSMHYNFAYMSEHLTCRTRMQVLEKMLTFEPAWFEKETNSSGALCHRLSNDASLLKTLVADRISLIIQAASGAMFAMTLGLIVAWKLALVMIALESLTVLCFIARKLAMSKLTVELLKVQIRGTQIASEAACNHRMITSFGCVDKVLELFKDAQREPLHAVEKDSLITGLTQGTATSLGFLLRALEMWYGAKLIESHEALAGDVFKTFVILVATARVIADAGSMTSDLAKGASAVASVLQVLDRESLIPKTYQEYQNADKYDTKKIHGKIDMVEVDFTYPSRPQSPVLRKFNLEVEAGSSIGLVGQTGCGKSTVIGLIQRFYDVDGGVVRIDGIGLRQLNVMSYRGFTALVSQEPVIYSGSIRYNISFGRPEASEEELVKAAKAANAHAFICSLEQGYDTDCGERGVQLSGGQKQRIAIARAVIRNPAILLLDEATSALDVQSELVVQEALDRVMEGRTTVVVAHRLNTIRNLDSIAFLREGKVVEHGSYKQLMDIKGALFHMGKLQTRGIPLCAMSKSWTHHRSFHKEDRTIPRRSTIE